ncbi:fumarylacetoacetate hydrolase family protein [Pseudomonas chengduensis]|uniref:2-keto-4-pentenoate hydratase/2-oxohepta-3-ene-1,7-dioic acid hydratase (Catechol pathway) n=1 Tax=Ectopseudomonas chengduensis TaxID=489632 RepID=A0A1G6IVI8_9GAMM|nr:MULTISPECIES: fumarylacetoacetate hydrolase family protein [Pseudomonas]MBP3059987.1 2-hydroxyhepta-2,4-diene-1,7-dioate isomerase [Pseudomonas chengduensis]MDH0622663.1 fumarylacetoacetate hydrolase family protein [Pseudomonas chengduensis]MDH0956568.1 fumarylacetoacetate hydrolase family protein [Pseudomonas chengduensis]MDH1212242.1 fumarylacetoacetate hydrolase family protein [Pseudomonas chengduensis]MDH1534564.1 fumarylacetoacetate hydrolase family protein [Pseudomonas chengduensis]
MKLLRYGPPGQEKPALLAADGSLRDLSLHVLDISPRTLDPKALDELRALDPLSLPRVEDGVRIGTPIANIGKLICVGLNYADHAKESNLPVPSEPVLFMKATSAICGPNDAVIIPRGSEKTDWEVELGIVIGRKAQYVEREQALEHVAGYCIVNDVSERAYQLERGGTWDKGKGCDTFAPIGPWLVTPDEITDLRNLDMHLSVNGETRQNGNTRTMIFSIDEIVSYISQFMTLNPGDVICTGTPPGVGAGMQPPQFLKPGDRMRLSISGLGEQRQNVVAWQR